MADETQRFIVRPQGKVTNWSTLVALNGTLINPDSSLTHGQAFLPGLQADPPSFIWGITASCVELRGEVGWVLLRLKWLLRRRKVLLKPTFFCPTHQGHLYLMLGKMVVRWLCMTVVVRPLRSPTGSQPAGNAGVLGPASIAEDLNDLASNKQRTTSSSLSAGRCILFGSPPPFSLFPFFSNVSLLCSLREQCPKRDLSLAQPAQGPRATRRLRPSGRCRKMGVGSSNGRFLDSSWFGSQRRFLFLFFVGLGYGSGRNQPS